MLYALPCVKIVVNTAIYFHYFGSEYIPQQVSHKIRDKPITHNILRIQDNESILCEFYCIAFIEHMLVGQTFLNYTNLFPSND